MIPRNIWKPPFKLLNKIGYPCPICGTGSIHLIKDSVSEHEDRDSKQAQESPAWDPTWISGHFSAKFKCGNPECEEIVLVQGVYNVDEEYDRDQYSGEPTQEYVHLYKPLLFTPPVRHFDVADDVPESVTGLLAKAFESYWVSPESSINFLRSSVEYLLDDYKVPRFETKGGKRWLIALHRRLVIFAGINKENADLLMAVKWLGNTGSHGGGMGHDNVLDAMDILAVVFDSLYEKRKVVRSAKSIVKKKGKITK